MLKGGLFFEENGEIIELKEELVNQRISELEREFEEKKDANIFMYDIQNFHFTNETINKKIKKLMKKEKKEKVKVVRDRKKKSIFEMIGV